MNLLHLHKYLTIFACKMWCGRLFFLSFALVCRPLKGLAV